MSGLLQRAAQQLKTLGEELSEPRPPQKQNRDPVKLIEANARILKAETPDISDILITDDACETAPDRSDPHRKSNEGTNGEVHAEETRTPEIEHISARTDGEVATTTTDNAKAMSGNASVGNGVASTSGESVDVPAPVKSPQVIRATGDESKPEITLEAKLMKFARYEEKYPQLLKAYRIEKRKGELVKAFEEVLAEATPVRSISEPQQMLNFIQGLHAQNDILKSELSRVTRDGAEALSKAENRIEQLVRELASSRDSQKTAVEVQQQSKSPVSSSPDRAPSLKSLNATATGSDDATHHAQTTGSCDLGAESDADIADRAETLLTINSSSASEKNRDGQVTDLAATTARVKELEGEVQTLQLQARTKSTEVASLRDRLQAKESENKKLTNLVQDSKDLKAELVNSKRQLGQVHSQLETAQATLVEAQNSSADLKLQLEQERVSLRNKLTQAEATRAVQSKAQELLRTQLDEMSHRLAETTQSLDILRDDAGESARLAAERLEELQGTRELLRKGDRFRQQALDDAKAELSTAVSEREILESEVESLGKRLVRDVSVLESQIASLREQLRESERHTKELSKSGTHQSTVTEPKVDEALAKHLKSDPDLEEKLEQARREAASAFSANELLKRVNEDASARIERLQKAQKALQIDVEALRAENSRLHEQQERRSSISSLDSHSPAEISSKNGVIDNKQRAYVKNVILGFLEHRDQRRQLLPVLAQLLAFEPGDEQRFWGAFS